MTDEANFNIIQKIHRLFYYAQKQELSVLRSKNKQNTRNKHNTSQKRTMSELADRIQGTVMSIISNGTRELADFIFMTQDI